MLELIVAIDENYGIGKNGTIPWKCDGDRKLFRQITTGEFVIMGRKTCESLPLLKGRDIICLSRGIPDTKLWKNDVIIINTLDEFKKMNHPKVKFLVAGGAEIYESMIDKCNVIHLSIIDGVYGCDTYFKRKLLDNFVIKDEYKHTGFKHYTMIRCSNNSELQYLNIATRLLNEGDRRTGRNGNIRSLFTEHMKFDLREGFPLLTTKKMFVRGIIEELLFFLRGDTDTTILSDKNIHIWDGNTTSKFIKSLKLPYASGVMGPMYGYQWRHFNAPYITDTDGKPVNDEKSGIDQLKNVIDLINSDPNSRRILMTTYNPSQANEGVLYPCHSIVSQFYVVGKYLDMFCYNRSQDFFLGTPYNIASSSLLLIIIAKLTLKTPRYFTLTTGDTHVYESHVDFVRTQISRIPYKKPTMEITGLLNNVDDIKNLDVSDFVLSNYQHNTVIHADMVV